MGLTFRVSTTATSSNKETMQDILQSGGQAGYVVGDVLEVGGLPELVTGAPD